MAYDEEEISILVAKRLGVDPADSLRFVPLIPAALLRACRKFAARHDLRHYVQTDPATTTVTLDDAGAADLSALETSPRIILDYLRFGDITHADYRFPLRELTEASHGVFASALDTLFPKYWLEGSTLKTRIAGENALAGDLAFRVPRWLALADAPDIVVETEGLGVADSLIELLAEEPDGDDSTDTH